MMKHWDLFLFLIGVGCVLYGMYAESLVGLFVGIGIIAVLWILEELGLPR